MGRELFRPEDADSWGEFRARLEFELAESGSWLTPLWGIVAAMLFVATLLSVGYAIQDHWPLMWLSTLATVSVLGVMSVRAVERSDQRRARAVELSRLEEAWHEHLAQVSSTGPGPAKQ